MEITLDHQILEEDQQLMQELVEHRPEALRRLYQRYHTLLKSIIMQVLQDESEAEDVLQEVLIQVWERAGNYTPEKGKPISWLSTLTRRRAIDRVRQRIAYRRVTDRYEIECQPLGQGGNQSYAVETEANREDLKKLLLQHLKNLPIQQQEVIHLTFFESKTQREISNLTGTPLGTVKTRIELGMKKLTHSLRGTRDLFF